MALKQGEIFEPRNTNSLYVLYAKPLHKKMLPEPRFSSFIFAWDSALRHEALNFANEVKGYKNWINNIQSVENKV